MSIFEILLYLNKISLFAFIITLIFLSYQFYLIKKDISLKSKKNPSIPDFNENIKNNLNYTPLINREEKNSKDQLIFEKKSPFFIYGGILILITLLIFFLLAFIKKERSDNMLINEKLTNNIPTDTIEKKEQTPTSFITQVFLSPTEKLTTPTPILIITKDLEPSINQKNSFSEPTITYIRQTESLNFPTRMQQLPISGITDKNFLIIAPGVFLILFSLFF